MGVLRDQALCELRIRRYSPRTLKAYIFYMQDFARFHMRDPRELGEREIKAYLLHLVEERKASASAQNVATSALKFLYRYVIGAEVVIEAIPRPRVQHTLPKVLERAVILQMLERAPDARVRLAMGLMYGSGLRVSECARLRLEDVELEALRLWVRDGKGRKDRQTLPSPSVVPALKAIEAGESVDLSSLPALGATCRCGPFSGAFMGQPGARGRRDALALDWWAGCVRPTTMIGI